MYCTNCGTEVQEGWKVCPKCGIQVDLQLKTEKNNEQTDNLKKTKEGLSCEVGELDFTVSIGTAKVTGRKILKVLIIVAIACFFCPLYMVSCGNQEIGSLSGFDLTIGFTIGGEAFDGHLIFGLLALLPVFAFYSCYKVKKADISILQGKAEIKRWSYICAACMGGNLFLEIYLLSSARASYEDVAIGYSAMWGCHIMRIAEIASICIATYHGYLLESEEKNGEALSKEQKIGISIFNMVKKFVIIVAAEIFICEIYFASLGA